MRRFAARPHRPLAALLGLALAVGGASLAGGCIGKRRPRGEKAAAAKNAPTPAAAGKLVGPGDVDDSLSKLVSGDRKQVLYDEKDPYVGADAPIVTIVEYSDFQCPFCSRLASTLDELVEAYPEDVRLVFKQYPLPMHPDAEPAARAALAAHEQGKFWEMHDLLFANQKALEGPNLMGYAQQIGLDIDDFTKRFDSDEVKARVDADFKQGQAVEVRGTPSYYINGRFFSGAKSLDDLRALVDEERTVATKLLAGGSKRHEVYARIMKAATPVAAPAADADPEKDDDAPPADFKRGDANPATNYGVPVGKDRPTKGPDDALVTIIEFGSMACDDCKKNRETLATLRRRHPDVRFTFRQLPGADPKANGMARATLAAGAQDKFWEMRAKLLSFDGEPNQEIIFAFVRELGMDLDKFKEDLRNRDLLTQLREDKLMAETFHGSAEAPLFFVNGRVLQGAPSLEEFEKIVNEEKVKAAELVKAKGLDPKKDVYEQMRTTWRGAAMAEKALERLPG
jgi:protein-disulfide isomerase